MLQGKVATKMYIMEKTTGGMYLVLIKTKLLSDCRTVFIKDEITSTSADVFKYTVMYLIHEDSEAPIALF